MPQMFARGVIMHSWQQADGFERRPTPESAYDRIIQIAIYIIITLFLMDSSYMHVHVFNFFVKATFVIPSSVQI